MIGALAQLLHAALVLASAPVLAGIVATLRARLVGRIGPPVMQPWRDLRRLAGKQRVLAENASPVFTAAPFVVFAAIASAALLVPSFTLGMASAPLSDLLVIAGLLGLARGVMALAALDVGTAFGGMGASRELMFAALMGPALLLVILTIALVAGTTNLDAAAGILLARPPDLGISFVLALVAAAMVALTDCGRLPVGDPGARSELSMVQAAMALEYSGRDLMLIEAAGHLRLLLWFDLIAAIFVPFGMAAPGAGLPGWALGLVCWLAKLAALAVALAVMETTVARLRVVRVPEFLGIAVLLGLLAAILLFASEGFA